MQTLHPYPTLPPKSFKVVGNNLAGYAEPLESQGLNGTVIPHAGPAGSFASTRPAADPSAIGIITIQEATKENPYGGIKMLTPMISNVTAQDRVEAMNQAATMTNDPVQQGIKMFELLAAKSNQKEAAAIGPVQPVQPLVPPTGFVPVTQAQPQPQNPAAAPPAAAMSPEQWQSMMAQLAAMMQQPAARAADPPPGHPAAPPPVPLPPAIPLPPPMEYPPTIASTSARMEPPFSLSQTLQIPELDFQPRKPSAKVIFNLGQYGNMTAYYHWVLSEDNALFLVTDNRWEGTSYAPEKLGKDKPIKVTLSNTERGPQNYVCYSLGLTFTLGIFSIIILAKGSASNG